MSKDNFLFETLEDELTCFVYQLKNPKNWDMPIPVPEVYKSEFVQRVMASHERLDGKAHRRLTGTYLFSEIVAMASAKRIPTWLPMVLSYGLLPRAQLNVNLIMAYEVLGLTKNEPRLYEMTERLFSKNLSATGEANGYPIIKKLDAFKLPEYDDDINRYFDRWMPSLEDGKLSTDAKYAFFTSYFCWPLHTNVNHKCMSVMAGASLARAFFACEKRNAPDFLAAQERAKFDLLSQFII